jgi:hypothetical protein
VRPETTEIASFQAVSPAPLALAQGSAEESGRRGGGDVSVVVVEADVRRGRKPDHLHHAADPVIDGTGLLCGTVEILRRSAPGRHSCTAATADVRLRLQAAPPAAPPLGPLAPLVNTAMDDEPKLWKVSISESPGSAIRRAGREQVWSSSLSARAIDPLAGRERCQSWSSPVRVRVTGIAKRLIGCAMSRRNAPGGGFSYRSQMSSARSQNAWSS